MSAARPSQSPCCSNIQVSHDRYLAHSEPEVAENPLNPNNLVAASKMFTDPARYRFKIGTYYTTDGGRTWVDSGWLPGYQAYYRVSDVSLAFSPNGSLVYACVVGTNGNRTGILVSRSRDGGRSWLAPVPVFRDTTGSTFSDKPWIAVDQTSGPHHGAVYVAWNLDPGRRAGKKGVPRRTYGLVVARSTNYAHSFSAPVVISRFDRHHFALGAAPAVGPGGALHVAYLQFTYLPKRTRHDVEVSSSADGGITFTAPRTVAADIHALPGHLPHGTFRNFTMPVLAVSPVGGSMVVAWPDMRNSDADIFAARSGDSGRSWSAPVRVNDDPLHDGKDQFQPALAVSPDGAYTCSWFDRRYDRGDRLIDVIAAQSRNDGRSFGRNIRVTKRSWDPAIDAPRPEHKATNTFIGDYQGLVADALAIHPVWNDTQNGRTQEIRTASIPVTSLAH